MNEHAGDVMKTIISQTNVQVVDNYAHLEPSTGILHLCQNNTESMKANECPVIWPIPGAKPTFVNGIKVAPRSVEIMKNLTSSGELIGLTIIGALCH